MKKYKLVFADGTEKIVLAESTLEVVKKYDLASRDNINTKIIEVNDE